MREAILRWRDETGDAYVLGAVRVALGLMFLANALRAWQELGEGYFGDFFHWPLLPESLVPSRAIYGALVIVQLVLAVIVVVGRGGARAALLASGLLVTYVLACDRLDYHNNRWALACYAILLAFAPCDRSYRPGSRPAATRVGALWAARLAQLQVSIIYVASAGSKLLDPDWRGGAVMLERLHIFGGEALAAGIPQRVVDALSQPEVTSALAKLAIATELFLAVGLWAPRTRVFALWWGTWFHLVIQITSRVEFFTWLTLAAYALFVTPDVRGRKVFFDASRFKGRWAARAVTALDWFARFEVKAWTPDAVRRGHAVVVVRRDGTRATGVRALAMVARCTPLLFPLWAPLALLASFTRGGDAHPGA